MGLRLRLKASFSLAGFHGESLVILRALKRYGLIVADNGSSWYITGAPDPRWNDEDLDSSSGSRAPPSKRCRPGRSCTHAEPAADRTDFARSAHRREPVRRRGTSPVA